MHDIKFIRKYPEKFQKQMHRRGLNIDISSILEIEEAIRKKQAEIFSINNCVVFRLYVRVKSSFFCDYNPIYDCIILFSST